MPRAHTTAVSPGTNYNYQVALNEGLQYLKQGRLRQADQSFKYLVDKFPGAEGGYRGLAKVHFEQEDRASALRVLRDGAAALTKSGERPQAIGGHHDPRPRSRRPQRRVRPARRPRPVQSHRRPRPVRQPCGPRPPPNGPRKRRPTWGRRRARPRLPPRRRPIPRLRSKPMA